MAALLFIDSRVANYQTLIDGLSPAVEWFLIDGERDGIQQMRTVLAGRMGLDAIHIVSHGSPGALYLGGTVLDVATVGTHATALAEIGASLTQTGSIESVAAINPAGQNSYRATLDEIVAPLENGGF